MPKLQNHLFRLIDNIIVRYKYAVYLCSVESVEYGYIGTTNSKKHVFYRTR